MNWIGRRRVLTWSAGAAMLPIAAASAQDWYSDRQRRAAYEQWKAEEMRRREAAASREHHAWSEHDWNETQERNAWAHQQSWYR